MCKILLQDKEDIAIKHVILIKLVSQIAQFDQLWTQDHSCDWAWQPLYTVATAPHIKTRY